MGLESVELVMEFEDEFELEIPDADAERMRTVGDVVQYVARRLHVAPHDELAIQDIRRRICAITSEQMNIDRASISDSSRFYEDLGVT